jgi:hypothetical protein
LNPPSNLNGRLAFTGESQGYLSSRFNLSTLAGQNVKFRWRVGSDSSVSAMGWLVDDVSVYSCGDPPASPQNLTVSSSLPLKAVLNFSAPSSIGSSALTGYTATCSAVGQTTQTATGASSPITVKNLKPRVTYSCKVVANNSYGSGLESTTVQIKVRGVDLSAILSLLLD